MEYNKIYNMDCIADARVKKYLKQKKLGDV
jgi:hypothetical protein